MTESAAIQKEMLDEDNPRYLKTLEYLAEVCVHKGDYAVAVQHYLAINDANYEETAEEKTAGGGNIAGCCRLLSCHGK
ncbi:MAG: hypothetical protein V8Q36_06315 [Anaerotignum sp.]